MPSKPDQSRQSVVARLIITSDPNAVRDGLLAAVTQPPVGDLTEDQRGTAELVLAEVLNNIVEHAYATTSGMIEVSLQAIASGIACQVVDSGDAMRQDTLPTGALPEGIGGATDDLPEGGFGWHLIRSLTADLAYARRDGRNHLTFLIPTGVA